MSERPTDREALTDVPADELLSWVAEDCGNEAAEREILHRLRRAERNFQECFAAKESWKRAHDDLRDRLRAASTDAPSEEPDGWFVECRNCNEWFNFPSGMNPGERSWRREPPECPACGRSYGVSVMAYNRADRAPTDEVPKRYNELASACLHAAEIHEVESPELSEDLRAAARRLRRAEQDFQECFAAKQSWKKAHDDLRDELRRLRQPEPTREGEGDLQ